MKRRTRTALRTLICALAVSAGLAFAQEYTIDRWTIDGGGVMRSTGGEFELSGTIGQPDTGEPMTGNQFELIGGFWFPLSAGDCNEDGGVTLFDHAELDACLSGDLGPGGPGAAIRTQRCRCFDLNQSGDLELRDVSLFQQGFGY